MTESKLKFRLYSIKQISSYLNDTESLGIEEYKQDRTGLSQGFNLSFDEREGIFKIQLQIDFLYPNNEEENKNPIKICGLKLESAFKFIDFKDIVYIEENDKINIPDDLLINLLSITYSTARGLCIHLVSKTDYDGLYLPLLRPKDFLNNK